MKQPAKLDCNDIRVLQLLVDQGYLEKVETYVLTAKGIQAGLNSCAACLGLQDEHEKDCSITK